MIKEINNPTNKQVEASRKVTEDYLAYLERHGEERREEWNGVALSLNSVVREVRKSGAVSALAARDALETHNSTVTLLTAMAKAQSRMVELMADIKINGSAGSGDSDRTQNAMMGTQAGWTIGSKLPLPIWGRLAVAVGGTMLGGSMQTDAEFTKWYEEKRPYSVTNKALEASREAEKLAAKLSGIAYEEPSNDPPLTDWFMTHDSLPPYYLPTDAPTVASAAALLDEINTARAAAKIKKGRGSNNSVIVEYDNSSEYNNLMRHNGVEPNEMTYGLNTEYDHFMRYNSQAAIAAMPQSVQVVTQSAPAAAPEQTININMHNDFKMPMTDPRELSNIGDYLAQQIKEQLSSRGTLYSNNW